MSSYAAIRKYASSTRRVRVSECLCIAPQALVGFLDQDSHAFGHTAYPMPPAFNFHPPVGTLRLSDFKLLAGDAGRKRLLYTATASGECLPQERMVAVKVGEKAQIEAEVSITVYSQVFLEGLSCIFHRFLPNNTLRQTNGTDISPAKHRVLHGLQRVYVWYSCCVRAVQPAFTSPG